MKNIISIILLFWSYALIAQSPAIHVQRSGKGTPVIFLPGFTCPGEVWQETAANLKGSREHHFVSYAGFNGLPAISMPWYAQLKTELIAYIRNENLKQVTIIGHSMGGTLALDVAAELQEQIDHLVIVDALPCMLEVMMPGVSSDQLAYESPYNQRMLQLDDKAFTQTAAMMAQGMTNRPEKADTIIQWIKAADRETYVYGYTDLMKLDVRGSLPKIKAKTLVLSAAFPSLDMVKSTLDKQYASLTNKKISVVTDSRHFIMFDQPDWLYENINSFLDYK
jgi:pimeloyl-ACP methyl ester carboxylesterase